MMLTNAPISLRRRLSRIPIKFILLVSFVHLQVQAVNEIDFQHLLNLNFLPQEIKKMLTLGFPRGFLSDKYGIAIIAQDYRSDDPVMWYRSLNSSTQQAYDCNLARDYFFNCFLFNMLAKDFIMLLRFSRSGPRHLIPEAKHLTVNFVYHYCRMRFHEGLSTSYDTRGYCPNPCFNKTRFCQGLANNLDGQCEINFDYPYRDDGFKCLCKSRYVWSHHAMVCISTSSSLSPSQLGCYRNGTQAVAEKAEGIFQCICKKNYYGKKCEKLVDACFYPVAGLLDGNAACRIDHGNRCISSGMFYPTTDPFYHCLCTPTHKRNKSFSQDNCLHEYTPCDKLVCIQGACVSITYKKPAQCICKDGWYGYHCDIPVPSFDVSPWTQWSTCEPICGGSRTRQRVRMCLRLFCHMKNSIDVRPCRPRSCSRYHHPDSRDKFIMGVQLTDDKRYEVNYVTYCLILVVIFNMFIAAAYIQWRLLSPFLHLVATTKTEIKPEKKISLVLPDSDSVLIRSDR